MPSRPHLARDGPRSRTDLTVALGANLRRIRRAQGLSLQTLALASGVSRAMLSQVELGRSAPTINLLSRITQALLVPLFALLSEDRDATPIVLRARTAKILSSRDGRLSSRALFPVDDVRGVEFYELRLAPSSVETVEARLAPTRASLVAAEGTLTVVVAGERHLLEPGDAFIFNADLPHQYRNDGPDEARMYVVMTARSRIDRGPDDA